MKSETLNQLPNGWEMAKLEEVAIIVTGNTPPTNNVTYFNGDVPFFKPSDLNIGYVNDSKDKLSIAGKEFSKTLPKGSILVTCIGSTIGKAGIISKEGAFNQQINGVLPIISNPLFFYYQIISPNFQKSIKKNASATTVPILNKTKFGRLPFLIAPLSEQNQIVEKIEEVFSELEKNSELLQITIKQLTVYKKSILQHAFEGKATQQWRDKMNQKKSENELIKNIRKYWLQAYEKEMDKYNRGLTKKRPKIHEVIDLSRNLPKTKTNILPKEWMWVKLSDIVENESIKIHPNKNKNLRFVGMDCIEPNSLQPYKFYDFSEFKSSGNLFKKDHIIYGRMRPYLNKVWKAEFEGACSGEFIVLKAYDNLHPDYLKYNLYSSRFVTYASQKASGDRPRISFEEMGEFYFPLCSIEEQKIIVENLDKQLSYIDNLEKVITSTLAQAEASKRALLQKAFQGNLVKQRNTDEPASILLDKIKKELEAYLEVEKERKQTNKTVIKTTNIMTEEQKQIIDIIRDSNEPIPARKLWLTSPYKDDIEGFYAELKKLIESGQIIELPRIGKEALLKLNKSK